MSATTVAGLISRPLSHGPFSAGCPHVGGLTGGEVAGQVKRSVLRRFCFPPQEYTFKCGDTAVDPVSGRGYLVWGVDDEHGTIDLKAAQAYAGLWPAALVEDSPVNTTVLADRLHDLGDRVVREGSSSAWSACSSPICGRASRGGAQPSSDAGAWCRELANGGVAVRAGWTGG